MAQIIEEVYQESDLIRVKIQASDFGLNEIEDVSTKETSNISSEYGPSLIEKIFKYDYFRSAVWL